MNTDLQPYLKLNPAARLAVGKHWFFFDPAADKWIVGSGARKTKRLIETDDFLIAFQKFVSVTKSETIPF